jgi:hypothetical protein
MRTQKIFLVKFADENGDWNYKPIPAKNKPEAHKIFHSFEKFKNTKIISSSYVIREF